MRPNLLFAAALLLLSACATTHATAEAPPGAGPSSDDRLLVQTAGLHVEREAPERGVEAATKLASDLGGYVQTATDASATLRIPAPRLHAALHSLATLGKVTDRQLRTEDVTSARTDLALRIDNLKRTRERYLELLARAGTVEESLAVERELERLTLEVERLQVQLERVDSSVQLAAVHVRFSRPVRPGPVGWVIYGAYSAVKWLFIWD